MQTLGGTAEMQVLGDGDKIAQLMRLYVYIDALKASNNSKLILDGQ